MRCSAMPVRLQADGSVVADVFEVAELRGPIDEAFIYRRPGNFAVWALYCVLNMAVEDAMLRQQIPTGRKGIELAAHHCVGRVPVQPEVR